ncbi:MAG TPA: aldo/keto reductase [Acidimicrobiales bacterium]|jgi:pyridoxine 4-dehydrogenase|nr:aldo/keto reductase [Acidimicrobiales bacterium]HVE24238.1 aldo/keto reductase [Sporichthya sp.]
MESTLRLGDAEIPRIGLGTNRLTETTANVAFVRDAVAAGVGMIDTAHLYTGGQSEETIGAALAGGASDVVVATKGGFGGPGHGRPGRLKVEIEKSLRRLRTDCIDLYYLHRVDPETPLEDSVAAIAEYRHRGAIRHVGLSDVSIDQIQRAAAVVPIAAVQNRYNLSEGKHDEGVIDYCEQQDMVFVPYFPLRGEHGADLAQIAARHGATPKQIALAWLLKRSPAMLPIPGTLSLAHLKENLGALRIALTDEEFETLALRR